MRRGLALLLFGCLVASALAQCDGGSSSSEEDDVEFADPAALDRIAFRLERLQARIDALSNRIDSDEDIDHSIDVLSMLEKLEDDKCASGSFPCGDSDQCVSNSLACDGVMDCDNNADESNCANSAEAGEKFSGLIQWSGCKTNPDGQMTIAITSNKVFTYFPSTVWISATTTFDYGDNAHAFSSQGAYEFGRNAFSLNAGGNHVNSDCVFVGSDVIDCRVTNSAGDLCSNVRLSRA